MCCDFSVLVLLAYQQYIIQTPIAECNDRAEVSGGPKSPSRSPQHSSRAEPCWESSGGPPNPSVLSLHLPDTTFYIKADLITFLFSWLFLVVNCYHLHSCFNVGANTLVRCCLTTAFVSTGAQGSEAFTAGRLQSAPRRHGLRGCSVEGDRTGLSPSRPAWMLFPFHAGRLAKDPSTR